MYEKQLEQFFKEHKAEMVEDICSLIEIPSVVRATNVEKIHPFGDNAAACIDKFLEIAKEKGFSTTNLDYYVAFAEYDSEQRAVDVLVHLDVVEGGDGWTITEPFKPVIQDGKIYGRGSADDKGPAVMALYAIWALKELGIPMKKSVRMVVGSNEENGEPRLDIERYYRTERRADVTLSPDADYPVINCEKGYFRGKINTRYTTKPDEPHIVSIDSGSKRFVIPGKAEAVVKGVEKTEVQKYLADWSKKRNIAAEVTEEERGCLKINISGRESHVGAPEKADNAVTAIIDLLCGLMKDNHNGGMTQLRKLNEIFPHGDYLGKAAGIARKTLDSGELYCTLNIFHYEMAQMNGSFDCKTPDGVTKENSQDVLEQKLSEGGIEVYDCTLCPPHYVPLDSPLVQTCLKYCKKYIELEETGMVIDGNTYVFGIENGIAFGCQMPGVDNFMHMGNEFVEIEDLILSARIYAETLIDLCN